MKSVQDFLLWWVQSFEPKVFCGKRGPEKLVTSLSCENARHDEFTYEQQQCLTKFRHLRQDARLAAAKRALGED